MEILAKSAAVIVVLVLMGFQVRRLVRSARDLRDNPTDRYAMLSLIAVIAVMVPACWFGETLTRLSPDSPEPSYVVRRVAGAVALLAWSLLMYRRLVRQEDQEQTPLGRNSGLEERSTSSARRPG